MWKTTEGSTGRLLQLCLGYFFFYIITGLSVKYFLGSAEQGLPHVSDMEYLFYSSLGGSLICLLVVFVRRWYRLQSNQLIEVLGIKFPSEFLYIIPSGICTAVVIPTTTLMYSLPISVMVAMVIMRGSVIVSSRIIDAIQIKQGILHKKVFIEEEFGVAFAIFAVAVHLLPGLGFFVTTAEGFKIYSKMGMQKGSFDFLHSPAAMGILCSYLTAYFIRLYIMNYYKNTRGKGVRQDNKGFFGIEQIAASLTMLLVVVAIVSISKPNLSQIIDFQKAVKDPTSFWPWEILGGTAFGIVAFFSVFLFMFKGRTATFAGLANRLTSLVAGTAATLIFHYAFGGKFPKPQDWISLVFIFIAVAFLARAEKKRAAELKAAKELE